MSKKEIAIIFLCVSIIFTLGFVLRVESTHLTSIPSYEKAYYQDQYGLPYMYEPDSYYNYRLTRNYVEHGYIGDIKLNGKNWDLHSHYPPGTEMSYPPLIVYIAAFLYKFMNLFLTIPLIVTCFWLPALMGPLSGVVAYLFVRRFTNEYGGFAAGIFAVTAPFYFLRTVPGWFDTDMFNVFFPILIIWLIIEAVSTRNPKKSVIFAILAAFSTALFSIAWNGWSYIFYIIILSFLGYMLLCKVIPLKKSKDFHIKSTLSVFLVYLSTTMLLLLLSGTLAGLLAPFSFLRVAVHSTWPNINVSVSELRKPSLEEVVSGVGPAFFGGIFGLLLIFRVLINKKLKKLFLDRMTWLFYLILILWTIMGFISVKDGVRFIMFLIPPLVIISGIMVGLTVDYVSILKESQRSSIKENKKLITTISLFVLLIVTVPAILDVSENTLILQPGINDDMADAATWLNQNTSNDTVIFSYWSYGHFFTVFADRPFSVDGGSTNTPRTYFVDKAFATDNETLAKGILRMIATNGDKGYLTLDNYTKNSTKTAEILNNILGVDKGSALTILTDKYGLSLNQAQNILNFTHPEHTRPFVILTYGEMIKKGYWAFYFGDWDFNAMKGYDITYSYGDLNLSKNYFKTTNNVTMDQKTGTVKWNRRIPYVIITVKNGFIKKQYLNGSSNICVILQMDSKQDVVLNKQFENSTFVKLVIERTNSTYFKMAHENKDVSIYTET